MLLRHAFSKINLPPYNLLELRFKLLNLGKEPKSEHKFPSVKRLKDKSRTSNCGRPEKSLSL
jgi:hypothetical protein